MCESVPGVLFPLSVGCVPGCRRIAPECPVADPSGDPRQEDGFYGNQGDDLSAGFT